MRKNPTSQTTLAIARRTDTMTPFATPARPMRLALPLLCLLLTACAARYSAADLPTLAAGDVRTFRLDRLHADGSILQSSLLVVHGEAGGHSRWLQSDAFGAPQARLLATANGWQRDGFAPPNRDAERLFIRLFPLLDSRDTHHIDGWRITPLAP
ncbi:MAG: hypothetical protein Q4D61_09430 [Cardiobacteriaceae bacterium]|nr:hypothetical protein [Cardiobacteriaceae bacterium]